MALIQNRQPLQTSIPFEYSQENDFLQQAIDASEKSLKEKRFPAGAVLVKEGRVIAVSGSAPGVMYHLHGESQVIDQAMNQFQTQLTDAVIYGSMEPCLMCLARAYWAGIRKMVYAIRRQSVPSELCYEGKHDAQRLLKDFHARIELIQVPGLEQKALAVVNKWLQERH